MRRFNYKARDSKSGKTVKGTIQAENERAAGKLLLDQGYVPDYVEENVSSKVVKIIQSYTGVVNKMVWRKF